MEQRDNADFILVAEFQALKLLTELTQEETTGININMFPHEAARAVYEAIFKLKEAEESITEGSLLREANKICDKVGIETVKSVLDYKADRSNWLGALQTLREGSLKYNLQITLDALTDKLAVPDTLDAVEASNILYKASEVLSNGGGTSQSKTLEEMLTRYEEELEDRRDGKCYSFGDLFLDKQLTRKAAPGQIITIIGTTGMGKSGYSLNLINTFINLGTPCMYFSLEMDEISTTDRLMAMREGIPIQSWYEKENVNSLLKRVAKQKSELAGKPFAFIDNPSVSLDSIRSEIRSFKQIYKTDYAIVFIDLVTQLQDFVSLKGNASLANVIEMAVNKESAISKTENVCFVNVAQLNRETDSAKVSSVEGIEAYRPTLTQIKNSNAIGERSRTVLSVFRPKYYADRLFPNDETLEYMEDILEVQILKQSQGPAGPVGKYLFEGECMSLKPYIEVEGDVPKPTDGEENG